MAEHLDLSFLTRLAKAITAQFGSNCEVAIHDLTTENWDSTLVAIENGQVTDRKVGDGPSHIVLETLKKNSKTAEDQLDYLSKTHDGRILKSSTVYIKDENDCVKGIFAINYDITGLLMAESSIQSLLRYEKKEQEPEKIPQNVNELLDELIEQSVRTVGKPVALMSKDDKIKAIQFLNNAGAFLITKSGDKVSKYFGISKYTLYSYIDAASDNEIAK